MMRALRLSRSISSTESPSIRLEDVPIPFHSEGHLLIKIYASAIQPSDVLNAQGSFSYTTFPRIVGRDFAGIIVAGRWYVQDPGLTLKPVKNSSRSVLTKTQHRRARIRYLRLNILLHPGWVPRPIRCRFRESSCSHAVKHIL
jgi:hypothetical protein